MNHVYDKFKEKQNPSQMDKDQYSKSIEYLREKFVDLVANRKIGEDQYKMLDDMLTSRVKQA